MTIFTPPIQMEWQAPAIEWQIPAIADLTLEEKVGQLLVMGFDGQTCNEDAEYLIRTLKVSGIVYFDSKNGLTLPSQVLQLSTALQRAAALNRIAIPLLIGLDQEGGVVARLKVGFTSFPGNRALAIAADPSLAEASAYAVGKELRAVGVNLNFAPVVDVNNNPKNPVIGTRSFGPTAEIVSRFGKAALEGYQKAGVLATLKHFPGHGDVEVDSHEGLPVVNKSLDEMEQCELLPFAKLSSRADAIMTAHLMVPAIDDENCSTFSRPCLNLLRDRMNFKGVIISDCLTMSGALDACSSVQDAALKALRAGCDLLLCCKGDMARMSAIHSFIVEAVKSHAIEESAIDQALKRIFAMKERVAFSSISDDQDLTSLIGTPDHADLAMKIATLALQVTKGEDCAPVPALKQSDCAIIAPVGVKANLQRVGMCQIGKTSKLHYLAHLQPTSEEARDALSLAKAAEVVIAFSYNAWKYPSQDALINDLIALQKPIIIISLTETLTSPPYPKANVSLSTFSPSLPSMQAARDYLIKNY